MISVFTPSHDTRWLNNCYESLRSQTYDTWEWVVLLNGEAAEPLNELRVAFDFERDPRVKVFRSEAKGVGALKADAVAYCEGVILLELDHDDFLEPYALELVAKAFDEKPDVVLVYSDSQQVQHDAKPDRTQFDPTHGWTYYETGGGYIAARSFDPHPHNFGYIWYAPNHLRAFTYEAYDAVGGYNTDLDILDDQDLLCRLFIYGEAYHIQDALYCQRMHDGNTQRDPEINARIQTETVNLYHRYIEDMSLAWAKRMRLNALDLGAYHSKPEGFTGIDLRRGPNVEVTADYLNFDLPESFCGVIRAHDFIEHVADRVRFMEKAWDDLCHGGMLLISVPSSDGRGAFQDPTHVSFWNENSFWYYTDPFYADFIETRAKFQVSHLSTFFPSEWHRVNNIPYVRACLIAIKFPGHQFGGPNKWN
jgi:O-antigen biosynthesis protein